MPKLHDLCQQFWEELSAGAPGTGRKLSSEEIVDIAHTYLQQNIPRDAEVLRRHLLVIAREMNIDELQCEGIEELTESLFG